MRALSIVMTLLLLIVAFIILTANDVETAAFAGLGAVLLGLITSISAIVFSFIKKK